MEIFAFITGIAYLVLEIFQNKYMWLVNLLCAAAYAVVFAQSRLYAAMGLQIYYVLMSIYGFWAWQRDKRITPDPVQNSLLKDNADSDSLETASISDSSAGENGIVYRYPTVKWLVGSLLAFSLIFTLMLTFLRNMTGDPMPVADAFSTSLSIVATVWLSRSFIHQWIMWIVVNVVSVGLFLSQGLYLTSVLYMIYALSALYGFFHWKKKGTQIESV